MTQEEKEQFIDNIPDVYLYMLYQALYNPRVISAMQDYNKKMHHTYYEGKVKVGKEWWYLYEEEK